MVEVPSDTRAKLAQLAFKQRADFVEALLLVGLETQDQRRLRIRGAHETPSTREVYPCPVDINRVVVRTKLFHRPPHHLKLEIVGAVQSQLGREKSLRQIAEN